MNSVSHQQRMMEIQHMSNACLVTLLPRVQETLQGASKDGSVFKHTKYAFGLCFIFSFLENSNFCLNCLFYFNHKQIK